MNIWVIVITVCYFLSTVLAFKLGFEVGTEYIIKMVSKEVFDMEDKEIESIRNQ